MHIYSIYMDMYIYRNVYIEVCMYIYRNVHI